MLRPTNMQQAILYTLPSPKFGAEQLRFVDFSRSRALPIAGKPRDRLWSRSSSRELERTVSLGNVP